MTIKELFKDVDFNSIWDYIISENMELDERKERYNEMYDKVVNEEYENGYSEIVKDLFFIMTRDEDREIISTSAFTFCDFRRVVNTRISDELLETNEPIELSAKCLVEIFISFCV